MAGPRLLGASLGMEVLRWRVCAAFLWHLIVSLPLAATFVPVLPGRGTWLVLLAGPLGFLAQLPLLSSRPAPLARMSLSWAPRTSVTLAGWLGPWTSPLRALQWTMAWSMLTVSASLVLLPWTPSLGTAGMWGAALATAYLHHAANWSLLVVCPLPAKRPRMARVKQELPTQLLRALVCCMVGTVALVVTGSVAGAVFGHAAAAKDLHGLAAAGPVAVLSLAAAAALTTAVWVAGSVLLRVTLREPLQLKDLVLEAACAARSGPSPGGTAAGTGSPLSVTCAVAAGESGDLASTLALRFLSDSASGVPGGFRAFLWLDDGGRAWADVAGTCLEHIERLLCTLQPKSGMTGAGPQPTSTTAAVLPPAKTGEFRQRGWDASGIAAQRVPLPVQPSKYAPVQGQSATAQAYTSALVSGSLAAASSAASALAGFCRAAAREDGLGVTRLGEPGLGAVLHALLRLHTALAAFERGVAALTPAAARLPCELARRQRLALDAGTPVRGLAACNAPLAWLGLRRRELTAKASGAGFPASCMGREEAAFNVLLGPVWAVQDAVDVAIAGLADLYGTDLVSALEEAARKLQSPPWPQDAARVLRPFL